MTPVYDSRHRSVAPSAYSRASVYSYYSTADDPTWTDLDYSRERETRAGSASQRASSSAYKPDTGILRSPTPESPGPSERRPDPFRGSYWRRDGIRPTLMRRPTKRELELKAQCNELLRKLKQKEEEIQQLKGFQRREQQAEIDSIERKLRRLSVATTASKTHREGSPSRHSSYSRPGSIIYFGNSRPSYAPPTRRADALVSEEEAMARAREQALRRLVSPKPAVTIPSTPWDIAQRLRGMALEDKLSESRPPDPPQILTPPILGLPDAPNAHSPKPPMPPPKPPKPYMLVLPKVPSRTSWNRPIRRSQYKGAAPLSPTARDEEPPTPKPRRRPHPRKSTRLDLPKAKLWTVPKSALDRAKEIRSDTERAGRRGLSMLPLPSPPFARPPPDVPVSPCSPGPSSFSPEGTPVPVQVPAPNPYASPKESAQQDITLQKSLKQDEKQSSCLEPNVPPYPSFTPLDGGIPAPRSKPEPEALRSVPSRTQSSPRRLGSPNQPRPVEDSIKTDTVGQEAKRTDIPVSAPTSATRSASLAASPAPSGQKPLSPKSPQGRLPSSESPPREPPSSVPPSRQLPSPKSPQRGAYSPKSAPAGPAQTPQTFLRTGMPHNPYLNGAGQFYPPAPRKTNLFGRRWRGFLRRRTHNPYSERLAISAPIPNDPYTHPILK